MNRNTNWLLFDLTGVLSSFAFQGDRPYEVDGVQIAPDRLEAIFCAHEYEPFMLGKITQQKIVSKFLERRDLDITMEMFVEVFKQSLSPITGMDEVLQAVCNDFKLAVLTNEGLEWAQYKLDRTGYKDYFDKIIVSAEIGEIKPDKTFFEKSLRIIDALPEECIFIDDSQENCRAAEGINIRSIHFKSPEQLVSSLENLL